jgi:hypothetical protein
MGENRTCPECRTVIPQHEEPNPVRALDTVIGDSSHFSFCFTTRVSLLRMHRRFIARMLVLLALLSMGNI